MSCFFLFPCYTPLTLESHYYWSVTFPTKIWLNNTNWVYHRRQNDLEASKYWWTATFPMLVSRQVAWASHRGSSLNTTCRIPPLERLTKAMANVSKQQPSPDDSATQPGTWTSGFFYISLIDQIWAETDFSPPDAKRPVFLCRIYSKLSNTSSQSVRPWADNACDWLMWWPGVLWEVPCRIPALLCVA